MKKILLGSLALAIATVTATAAPAPQSPVALECKVQGWSIDPHWLIHWDSRTFEGTWYYDKEDAYLQTDNHFYYDGKRIVVVKPILRMLDGIQSGTFIAQIEQTGTIAIREINGMPGGDETLKVYRGYCKKWPDFGDSKLLW